MKMFGVLFMFFGIVFFSVMVEAFIEDRDIILIPLLIIPTSLIVIGSIILAIDIKGSMLVKKLKVEGRCVQAPVHALMDSNLRVNHVTQIWVVVMHEGQEYRSKAIPPRQANQLQEHGTVDLYLANDNSGDYVVDTKGTLKALKDTNKYSDKYKTNYKNKYK